MVRDREQEGADEKISPNFCGMCGKFFNNLVDGEEHEYNCTGGDDGGDDSPRDSGEEGTIHSIRLPHGPLDFSLTEYNGMCVAEAKEGATSTSATSTRRSDIQRGDIIMSMNEIDFGGLGGVSVWNQLLESAEDHERILLVSRRVVQEVNHSRFRMGMGMGMDLRSHDDDVLSLPFCQGKHDISALVIID